MTAETSDWGTKLFPEIRISVGTKAPVALPRWLQGICLSVLVVIAGVLSYLGIARIGDRRLVADEEAAVVRAQTANAALRTDIDGLHQELAASSRNRDQAEGRLAVLASEADALRGRVRNTDAQLQSLDQTLHQVQGESAALSARLHDSEADRAAEEAQFAQYKASFEEAAEELRQLGAGGAKGAAQRARFRVRLGELWQKLSQAASMQTALQSAAAPPSGAPSAPADGSTSAVVRFGREEIAAFERVLASAGVDVARLFAQFGVNRAEGGPFVPPPNGIQAPDAVDPEKLAAIRGMANVLPLAAPLAQYQVGSPFGPRTDPFNGKAAFHTGIDMDAPYSSPVYATAPGTVIYAGYLGDYGKVVEIDHGFGIDTLYAHLQRLLVAVGQQVAAQTEIGLLGTTGRSSGPHVHYEVRVNGRPQDPEKFLDLSRLIPAAARQISPTAGAP
jgi:murein DD-endopeptidase MepM/ murein hydrolase activator NlpD